MRLSIIHLSQLFRKLCSLSKIYLIITNYYVSCFTSTSCHWRRLKTLTQTVLFTVFFSTRVIKKRQTPKNVFKSWLFTSLTKMADKNWSIHQMTAQTILQAARQSKCFVFVCFFNFVCHCMLNCLIGSQRKMHLSHSKNREVAVKLEVISWWCWNDKHLNLALHELFKC